MKIHFSSLGNQVSIILSFVPLQISPTSGSPRLSDTEIFPHFLRTVAGEDTQVFGIIQAMKQFGWSRIAVITEAEKIFTFVSVN